MYEIFAQLLQKYGVTAYKVSKETGVSQATLSAWKAGDYTPKVEKLQKIADYFNVSLEYLMTGSNHTDEPQQKTPTLTKKDERDIARQLDSMLGQLDSPEGSLMFDGEPLDDETRELLRISLQNQLEMTKRLAKAKFTPKKYRKD